MALDVSIHLAARSKNSSLHFLELTWLSWRAWPRVQKTMTFEYKQWVNSASMLLIFKFQRE